MNFSSNNTQRQRKASSSRYHKILCLQNSKAPNLLIQQQVHQMLVHILNLIIPWLIQRWGLFTNFSRLMPLPCNRGREETGKTQPGSQAVGPPRTGAIAMGDSPRGISGLLEPRGGATGLPRRMAAHVRRATESDLRGPLSPTQ